MNKPTTQYSDGPVKAIVSVPGWVEELGNSDQRGAGDPISAWSSVPLLYRAVNLRCQSLAAVPFVVFKGDDEVEWPLPDTMESILYNAELALMLSGAAYLLKQYDGRTLTGIQWLNPTTVTWKYEDGENRYSQKIGDKTYGPWGDDVMVALREPSMSSDVGPGVPPAQVALMASQLRFNMDDFVSNFFAHGAQPMSLITTTGTPSQSEMERAQNYFRRTMTGVANAWKAIFLRGDIKVQQLTPELSSMEMPQVSERTVLDISAALGIPRSVLESDAANYATSQTDMRSFWEMTVRPRLAMYEQMINEQLLGDAVDGYQVQFTPENLDVFQADEAERSASLLQLVNAGVPLADAMAMLGYNPLENMPVPEDQEAVQVTTDEESEPSPGVQVSADQEMRAWQKYATRSLKKKVHGHSKSSTSRTASPSPYRANSKTQTRRRPSGQSSSRTGHINYSRTT